MSVSTYTYQLSPSSADKLKIDLEQSIWTGRMKSMSVSYGDIKVGKTTDHEKIKNGVAFKVPEGRVNARVKRKAFKGDTLEVELNGELVNSPDSLFDKVKVASNVVLLTGGYTFLLSAVAEWQNIDFLLVNGYGFIAMIVSLIYMMVGWLIREKSWVGFIALIIASLFYIFDFVLTIVLSVGEIGGAVIGLRIALLLFLLRAWPASWKLARKK